MKRADPSNSRFTLPHIRVDYDNEFCIENIKKKNNQRFYNQFLYLIIFVNSDEKEESTSGNETKKKKKGGRSQSESPLGPI